MDAGVGEDTARAVVDHMITADLWGLTGHGLSVRFGTILRLAEEGVGREPVEVVSDRGTSVLVDAHDGFGYAAGAFCTDLLIGRVREHGLCSVAFGNHRSLVRKSATNVETQYRSAIFYHSAEDGTVR